MRGRALESEIEGTAKSKMGSWNCGVANRRYKIWKMDSGKEAERGA